MGHIKVSGSIGASYIAVVGKIANMKKLYTLAMPLVGMQAHATLVLLALGKCLTNVTLCHSPYVKYGDGPKRFKH